MEMQNILSNFQHLCETPIAWALLGLVAARTATSVIFYFSCPVMHCREQKISPEDAQKQINSRFIHSPRFLVTMLTGIALTISGLYLMQDADYGPLALAAMVLGVFLMLVEPSRLSINDATLRLAAAQGTEGTEGYALTMDRARAAHLERIGLEITFTAALAALIMLY